MPATLSGLRINEVSLVDRPANQHAKVLLAKREPSKKMDPDPVDVHVDRMSSSADAKTDPSCRKCGQSVDHIDKFCKGCGAPFYKAEWDAKYINDLPDSAFAVIEPGGTKDADGKTAPRSKRHLPFKGSDGKVDLPHLRNALARLPQSKLADDLKAKAKTKLEAAAQAAGVGDAAKKALHKVVDFVALAVSKGYMDGQAQTLDEAVEDQEERELLSALWDALYSIFNDDTVSEADQASMVSASFDQFLTRLQGTAPQAKEASMTIDLSKVAPEIKAHIEKLSGDLKTAQEALAKAAPKQPEDVLKGLDGPARELVEKAQRDAADATKKADEAAAQVRKMQDEQRSREYVEKARVLKAIPGASATELGALLKAFAEKATPEEYTKLEALLKGCNDAIETGALFSERGHSGDGSAAGGSAVERVNALVKARMEKGASKTESEALSAVMRENPGLYREYSQAVSVKV